MVKSDQTSKLPDGQGSEFVVCLPVLSAPPPPLPREPSGVNPVATVPRRILVVDDNPDAADSLDMLLRLSGHEVYTASDGLEAVEVAAPELSCDPVIRRAEIPPRQISRIPHAAGAGPSR